MRGKYIVFTLFVVVAFLFVSIQGARAQNLWEWIRDLLFPSAEPAVIGGISGNLVPLCTIITNCESCADLPGCDWFKCWGGLQNYCEKDTYSPIGCVRISDAGECCYKELNSCAEDANCCPGLKCVEVTCRDPTKFSCSGNKLYYSGSYYATCTYCCTGSTNCGDLNACCKSTSCVVTPPPCTIHDQCSQACTDLCPVNVLGCCYGCKLGQCVSGKCECVDAVSYCSLYPPYQVGSPCVAPTTTTTTTTTIPACSGSVSLSISPNPASPSTTVTAPVGGLSNCDGKTVYIRDGSCSGVTKCYCSVSGGGCSCSFNGGGSCSPLSQPTYYSCIDKNGDGDFADSGESDWEVLYMICPTTTTTTTTVPPTTTTSSTTTSTTTTTLPGPTTTTSSTTSTTIMPTTTTTTVPPTTTTSTTSTSSTTTSTSTSTTTTTLPTGIQCDDCFARSKCKCTFTESCDSGSTWLLQNKERNPLESTITSPIPPSTVQFNTKETGKITVRVFCFRGTDTYIPAPRILEVKEPFLECDKECVINQQCGCTVMGCMEGNFTAVLGNIILKWKEKIDRTNYRATFVPEKIGTIDVDVECRNPVRRAEAQIPVTGEEVEPGKKFSASNFRSQKIGDSNKLMVDYVSSYGDDVTIVFTLSKEGEAKNKKFIAGYGRGTASVTFDCISLNLRGSYMVSWKAFKSTDKENPVTWSKVEDMVNVVC